MGDGRRAQSLAGSGVRESGSPPAHGPFARTRRQRAGATHRLARLLVSRAGAGVSAEGGQGPPS